MTESNTFRAFSTPAPYKLILSVSIHTRDQWHNSHLMD